MSIMMNFCPRIRGHLSVVSRRVLNPNDCGLLHSGKTRNINAFNKYACSQLSTQNCSDSGIEEKVSCSSNAGTVTRSISHNIIGIRRNSYENPGTFAKQSLTMNGYNRELFAQPKYSTIISRQFRNYSTDSQDDKGQSIGAVSPQMCIVYTCKHCKTRSTRLFSKHSYNHGIVIVQCPGCERNHLIADNLGWFDHVQHRNIEEILESRGESVKRVVGQDGTTELTLEDVVGTEKLKEALGQSGQEPPKSD